MHADAFYRHPDDREGGLAGPFALALALHVLVALLFWVAWWWSPQRHVEPAAGSPVIEASLVMSQADVAAAQKRADDDLLFVLFDVRKLQNRAATGFEKLI